MKIAWKPEMNQYTIILNIIIIINKNMTSLKPPISCY